MRKLDRLVQSVEMRIRLYTPKPEDFFRHCYQSFAVFHDDTAKQRLEIRRYRDSAV